MKALLIDGLNLIRRIYAAVPPPLDPDPKNEHIGGVVRSAVASLQRALNDHNPTHCLVVFEQAGRNWRHQLFPDYKKNRKPMPSTLQSAMGAFESGFKKIGVGSFSLLGYEADDVIATLAVKTAIHKGDVVILSTDRILCQLLNDNITVYDHFNNRYLDADIVYQKFLVSPNQIPELLALAGDTSVSIPGIKTIGLRTAAKLISDYGTLEKTLSASDSIPGKLGTKLFNGKEEANLALKLFSLKIDIDLGINLNQIRYVRGGIGE